MTDKTTMTLNDVLTKALELGASDIHLKQGIVPVIRRMGQLYPLDKSLPRLSGDVIKEIAYSMMSNSQIAYLEQSNEIEIGYSIKDIGRFRVSIFKQRGSVRMVIRNVSDFIPTIEMLNLPPIVKKIAQFGRGLVLVTGRARSGRSSTLAAMINEINLHKTRHILTIEDPIEYHIKDRKSMITQRELGMDTDSVSGAIKSAIRQDPDVIFVSELKTPESIEAALLACDMGYLVFSSVSASDVEGTLRYLFYQFEDSKKSWIQHQLAVHLKSIVSQRLARLSDGTGLIPAAEIYIQTPRLQEALLDIEKLNLIDTILEEGHGSYATQSLDQHLMQLVEAERISIREAKSLAVRPRDLDVHLKTQAGSKRHSRSEDGDYSTWAKVGSIEIKDVSRPGIFETDEEIRKRFTRGKDRNISSTDDANMERSRVVPIKKKSS